MIWDFNLCIWQFPHGGVEQKQREVPVKGTRYLHSNASSAMAISCPWVLGAGPKVRGVTTAASGCGTSSARHGPLQRCLWVVGLTYCPCSLVHVGVGISSPTGSRLRCGCFWLWILWLMAAFWRKQENKYGVGREHTLPSYDCILGWCTYSLDQMFAQVFPLTAVGLNGKWFASPKNIWDFKNCLAFKKGEEECVFADARRVKWLSHLGGGRQMLKPELVEVVHNSRNRFWFFFPFLSLPRNGQGGTAPARCVAATCRLSLD